MGLIHRKTHWILFSLPISYMTLREKPELFKHEGLFCLVLFFNLKVEVVPALEVVVKIKENVYVLCCLTHAKSQ